MTQTVIAIAPPPGAILAFEHIPYEGTEILAARHEDTVFVPMKAFCGSIGLPWDGARRRIDRDEVLKDGAVMMTVPSAGGPQLQQTLPLDLIPGFLFGADSNRYPPELRERVRTFRRTCYRVLADHFRMAPAGPAALVPAAPSTAPSAAAGVANCLSLVDRLRTLPPGSVRASCNELLDITCRELGIATPIVPIDAQPRPTDGDRIAALLAGLATLEARRVAFNHFGPGAGGRYALNLIDIARLFARHDIDVRVDDALRAAILAGDRRYRGDLRPVASKLKCGKAVLCHVLERAIGGEL